MPSNNKCTPNIPLHKPQCKFTLFHPSVGTLTKRSLMLLFLILMLLFIFSTQNSVEFQINHKLLVHENHVSPHGAHSISITYRSKPGNGKIHNLTDRILSPLWILVFTITLLKKEVEIL